MQMAAGTQTTTLLTRMTRMMRMMRTRAAPTTMPPSNVFFSATVKLLRTA